MTDEGHLKKIEETFLVLNVILSKTDALVRALKDWKIKEKDYVYVSLVEALLLQVTRFSEEYEQRLTPILKEQKKEWFLEVHEPLIKKIQDRGIRDFRNMHIAHSHRDRWGNFNFVMGPRLDSGQVIGQFDAVFLGKCVTSMIFFIASRLKNEYVITMDKLKKMEKNGEFDKYFEVESGFESYENAQEGLLEVIAECDMIYRDIFPDEEAWKKKSGYF